MHVEHGTWRVQRRRPGLARVTRLELDLGVHVRESQPLFRRKRGVVREALTKRLCQFVGPGVLPLDAVRVVRVHRAQQAAEPGGCGYPGKTRGRPRQIVRASKQGLLPSR